MMLLQCKHIYSFDVIKFEAKIFDRLEFENDRDVFKRSRI